MLGNRVVRCPNIGVSTTAGLGISIWTVPRSEECGVPCMVHNAAPHRATTTKLFLSNNLTSCLKFIRNGNNTLIRAFKSLRLPSAKHNQSRPNDTKRNNNPILSRLYSNCKIMSSIFVLPVRTSCILTSPFKRIQAQTVRRAISTRSTQHTLNTGAKIPAIGFGTFQDADAQVDAVSRALKAGCRLIDTARVYDVEKQVGQGIKESGVAREDVFVGTKLWCNYFHPDDVESALDDSLRDLDTPYVDLLMMHYPCTFARGEERFPRDADGKMIAGKTHFVDTWKAMEKLVETGKTKAIGVSNFSKGEIQQLLDQCYVVSNIMVDTNRPKK